MRTAAIIFFLIFCFRFLGGNGHVHASNCQPIVAAQLFAKAYVSKSTGTDDNLVFQNGGSGEESPEILSSVDDNEEQFTQRYVLQVRQFLSLSRGLLFNDRFNSRNGPFPFHLRLPGKSSPSTIELRVLRI